jgi:hypothetical protein
MTAASAYAIPCPLGKQELLLTAAAPDPEFVSKFPLCGSGRPATMSERDNEQFIEVEVCEECGLKIGSLC